MKSFIVTLVLVIFVLSGLSQAANFEITKIIEVDKVSVVPMLGPIKWSPDGTKLSYFKGKSLYFSDTLGNSEFIYEFEMHPHRYEWVSNDKIAFQIVNHLGHGSSDNQLITFDLNTNQETILSEYVYEKGYNSINGNVSFWGPFLTLEGNAYYETHTFTGDKSNTSLIKRSIFEQGKSVNLSDNSIIPWKRKGEIYRVKLDNSDSILIADKPWWFATPFVLSKEDSLILTSGYIIDLSTNETIDIGNITGPPPPNTLGCGMLYYSFNPQYPEMILNQGCDIDEGTVLDRVVIYNYRTKKLEILDPLINLTNCTTPVYHPEGKIIALLSQGKLYIIFREGLKHE